MFLAACAQFQHPYSQVDAQASTQSALKNTQATEINISATLPVSTAPKQESISKQEIQQPVIQPAPTPTSNWTFIVCSPLEAHPLTEIYKIVSDSYHPPPIGSDDRHQGVDFSYYHWGDRNTVLGVHIQAVLPGKVVASIHNSFPFGNLVIIETSSNVLPDYLKADLGISPDKSLYVLYAHMEEAPKVQLGASIESCQWIGNVGKSGNAAEPHLHLEARTGPAGIVFPGFANYKPEATTEDREYYLLWRTSGTFRHFDPMLLLDPRHSYGH